MLLRMVVLSVGLVMAGVMFAEFAAAGELWQDESSKPIRAGIIGLDTSHVTAFTKLLNAAAPKPELAGVRVVAAYPGGSPDLPASRDRVAGYTQELRDQFGVAIVSSIDELLARVDVVLLESVDGRPHLEQARPVFRRTSRCSLTSRSPARWPMRLPSSSWRGRPIRRASPALRSATALVLLECARMPKLATCLAVTPMAHARSKSTIPTYSGTACTESRPCSRLWGPAARRVSRVQTEGSELVTGVWKGGRIGTFRGVRQGHHDYGGTVFGTKGIAPSGGYSGYEPLVVEIVKFFKTGKPPVSAEETIEIFAFMEAADESKRQGGKPVEIEAVMAKARSVARK